MTDTFPCPTTDPSAINEEAIALAFINSDQNNGGTCNDPGIFENLPNMVKQYGVSIAASPLSTGGYDNTLAVSLFLWYCAEIPRLTQIVQPLLSAMTKFPVISKDREFHHLHLV